MTLPGIRPTRAALGTGPMILLLGAASVLVMAGLRDIGGLIGPVFLGLTLALTARPVGHWLRSHGASPLTATIVVLLLVYVVLFGMLFALGLAATQLVDTLPAYSTQFSDLMTTVLSWLDAHGVDEQAITHATASVNAASFVGVAQGVLSGLTSGASGVAFLLLSVAFLIIDTTSVRHRMAVIESARPEVATALTHFAVRVRRYWVVSAVFGVVLAIGDYVALLIIGVPLALTWAVVAFIGNFIPNLGFVVALVPPALLALLDGGMWRAAAVVVSYLLINFVVQTLVLPRYMGNAVGLNTTVTFLSLVFWTSIIGPLGALLAVPLTIFVKAVLIDSTPSLRWLSAFLSSEDDAACAGVSSLAGSAQANAEGAEQSGRIGDLDLQTGHEVVARVQDPAGGTNQ